MHPILQMQQNMGNAATLAKLRGPIQRSLTITNYNTKQGGAKEDQLLNIQVVRAAITQKVTHGADKQKVLTKLAALDGQNVTATDVQTLATQLSEGTTQVATEAQVRDAIGSTLINPKESEATLFDNLILRATSMSYQKGTPNVISKDNLERTVAGVGTLVTNIKALDTALQTPAKDAVGETDIGSWVTILNSYDLNIRTAHENGAGWLPKGNVAATFANLKGVVDTAFGTARQNPLAAAYSDEMLRYMAIMKKLQPDDRRYFAWGSYGGDESPYIEFGVPGEKDGRLVFDFETKTFFFTVHYAWHKGYNAFFSVTGT
jgi:hypothetical protein